MVAYKENVGSISSPCTQNHRHYEKQSTKYYCCRGVLRAPSTQRIRQCSFQTFDSYQNSCLDVGGGRWSEEHEDC